MAIGLVDEKPHKRGFYETIYGRSSGPIRSGRNNEVVVLTK